MKQSVAAKVSLAFVWMIMFCSEATNLRERSLGYGTFLFLVTVVKALSGPLGAATASLEVPAEMVVVGVGACLPCSFVIASCRYPWVSTVATGGCRGVC